MFKNNVFYVNYDNFWKSTKFLKIGYAILFTEYASM